MSWFATDVRAAERLLRVHIGDTAILHAIVGVGKRCLFATREAIYLVTYRQWLPFLKPRERSVRAFPLHTVTSVVIEERGDGTVCRLGLATLPGHLPPDGVIPDDQSILFVTLLAPGWRDTCRSLRYLVEATQFKASWGAGEQPGKSRGGSETHGH